MGDRTVFTIRRGFVAEVRCTLADYERHAAAMFAAHPVTRVVLTDREPFVANNGRYYWYKGLPLKYLGKWPSAADQFPKEIYDLLLPESGYSPGRGMWSTDTRDAALDALSAALVTWGRSLARLEAPCDDCDGTGRTMLGKVLNAGAATLQVSEVWRHRVRPEHRRGHAMTSTGDALFAALLADPTDQSARLVWAEWLEENGQPETAAWWRGEVAALLWSTLKGAELVIGYREACKRGGVTLTYDPDAALPVADDNSVTLSIIPGITYNPDPTPPVTDDSVSYPLTPDDG
jgi:uncharacterized protein (TIGR02996 family)